MTLTWPVPPAVSASWDVLYPRPDGWWSGYAERAGGRRYGLYDPATGRFQPVRPEDDAALPALARWLRRGELVAYRPGRRAMVRTADRCYAKVLRPRRVAPLVARTAAADESARRAGAGFPDLADVVGVDPDGVVRFAALPGRSLHDVLAGAAADAPVPALDRVGAALARFQVPAALIEVPDTVATEPAAWAALAGRGAPELASRYHDVLLGLPAPPSGRVTVLVHGDLHDRNVLLGAGVGFLDLDLLGRGSAATDVGNLAAHLVLRGLQQGRGPDWGRRAAGRLVGAYTRHGGLAGPAAVAAAGARTLFRLACLYRFRRRWQPLVPALLDEADLWASANWALPREENR